MTKGGRALAVVLFALSLVCAFLASLQVPAWRVLVIAAWGLQLAGAVTRHPLVANGARALALMKPRAT